MVAGSKMTGLYSQPIVRRPVCPANAGPGLDVQFHNASLTMRRGAGDAQLDTPTALSCEQNSQVLTPDAIRRSMMAAPTERIEKLFFEVFEPLPRQGPGSLSSAKRALDLCAGLSPSPTILDLGCGAGAQTFHLAELTTGTITAIDNHAPNIARLGAEATEQGLGERIHPLVGDIGKPDHESESFELVWSEGALYNISIEVALRLYHPIVKPGGYFAFTEAVWRKEVPPPEVKAAFEDYGGMGSVHDVLAKIEASDFSLVDHFTLPYDDWWDNFYTPMLRRIEELRSKYAGDAGALSALEEIAREPEMHRRHSDYYGYEFFVLRRV